MLHTSTKALNLRSSFEVMWRASEWKGELSPTKISVRHFRLFSPSVMSGRLQVGKTKLQNINIYSQFYLRRFYNMHAKKYQWRSSYGIVFTYWLLEETEKHLYSASHPATEETNMPWELNKCHILKLHWLKKKKRKWDGRNKGYQIPVKNVQFWVNEFENKQ